MSFFAILKSVYIEEPVADETVWHKRLNAPWFVRTIDGRFIWEDEGQIWRRKRNGKWEYQRDPETKEEYDGRIL